MIFGTPGAHLVLKWIKTMPDRNCHHIIYSSPPSKINICARWGPLQPFLGLGIFPLRILFASTRLPHKPVIDTHIRDALRHTLFHRNISTVFHSFHTFRRSGATFAFDHSVPLQNIMSHALWKSSAVWTYLQNASVAPSFVPSTFLAFIPASFLGWLGVFIFL